MEPTRSWFFMRQGRQCTGAPRCDSCRLRFCVRISAPCIRWAWRNEPPATCLFLEGQWTNWSYGLPSELLPAAALSLRSSIISLLLWAWLRALCLHATESSILSELWCAACSRHTAAACCATFSCRMKACISCRIRTCSCCAFSYAFSYSTSAVSSAIFLRQFFCVTPFRSRCMRLRVQARPSIAGAALSCPLSWALSSAWAAVPFAIRSSERCRGYSGRAISTPWRRSAVRLRMCCWSNSAPTRRARRFSALPSCWRCAI